MRKISALTLAAFVLLTAAPASAEDFLPLPPRVRPRLMLPQMADLGRDAQAGNPSDQWLLGAGYAYNRDGKRDGAIARIWLQKAAEQGYLEAEVDLGIDYYSDASVPEDKVKAAEWLRRAADHGSSDAQLALGELYLSGAGVDQDYVQAYVWYSLSGTDDYIDKQWLAGFVRDAAKHMTPAQIKTAKSQIKAWRALPPEPGQVIDDGQRALYRDDPAEAIRLWTPLANDGNAVAQFELSQLYAKGEAVPRDDAAAVAWLRKAADSGNGVAVYRLGQMTADGRGGARDEAAAIALYEKAAAQGIAGAQFELGAAISIGKLVPRDYAAAAGWFRRAADQGHGAAQYLLGIAYLEGRGVAVDPVEAYVWLTLAGQYYGDPASVAKWGERTKIAAGRLTPVQLSAAQLRIAAWHPVFEMPK